MKLFSKNQNKQLLSDCLLKLKEVRSSAETLVICPQTTGYNWMGVNVATKSLFPQSTFEIPQSYSNSILAPNELQALVNEINSLEFKQVVFSGFPRYFFEISSSLNTSIHQKVLFHGFLAEFAGNIPQQGIFSEIINRCQKGQISALGFVKKRVGLIDEAAFFDS